MYQKTATRKILRRPQGKKKNKILILTSYYMEQQFIKSYEEFAKKTNAFVIRTDRVRNEPKEFPNSKYLNFYVRVYIDIDPEIAAKNTVYNYEDINFVKYELHPSYKDRYRVSEDRANKFEIKIWTYGFFDIKASIYMKLAQSLELTGMVKFTVLPEEKTRNKGEVW